ncbi:MCE family protein [Nocardia jiangxiensis]|uniref:MCE family protein n=1 Tax=Nocardia jiangxiensis TaxID=282685 RepID=A0ABW6S5K5_9NOCA|nr:MlaD family protein [Nocardia jiangxiensis]
MRMKERRAAIGFTVFGLAALLVTVMMWNTLSRTISGATDSYSATFTDVLGLRPGDDVRMAGVRVGKVDTIAAVRDPASRKYVASVHFRVQRDQHLYHDTKALVRYQNLIGQRYVALEPGTKGAPTLLLPGGSIPLAQTEPSFDISTLLNGFEPLFETLDPAQVNDLTSTLIQALQGNDVSLSAFITQAAGLAGDFQRRDAILTDIIGNLSAVMKSLAARGDQLETLITQTRALVGGLYQQGKSLLSSTEQIAGATNSLEQLVTRIQPQIALAQDSAHDALTMLLSHGAQLDQAAVDLPALLSDAGGASQDSASVSAYVCSLDISLYGILLPRGILTQIGGNSHSAVCRP